MKKGAIVTVCGLILAFVCVPLVAQKRGINYQTYMVETFDAPDASEWSWSGTGSKFITEGYPILKSFDGMPNAVRVMNGDPEKEYKFLGIEFKFNRMGNNWVDIFPVKDDSVPYEIPFKGIVSRLDLWVWGAGYDYDLEVLVRDCNGRVHTLAIGNLRFEGWKNMSVNIPSSIPQSSRYISNVKQLKLVTFRIRTKPTEKVHDFYIFMDEIKVLTNTYSASYDGFELLKAEFGEADNTGDDMEGGK